MSVAIQVKQTIDNAFQGILSAHQAVDQKTIEHEFVVGKLTHTLALAVGATAEDADAIEIAARVHDIGKIAVPPQILNKNASLTEDEFALVKEHPLVGGKILSIGNHPTFKLAHDIALQHHERFDGTGYPYGLKGDEISFAARVTALCDIYDALRSSRSYKKQKSHEEAAKIITEGDSRVMPTMFDPQVLDAFKHIHKTLQVVYDGACRSEVKTLYGNVALLDQPPPA